MKISIIAHPNAKDARVQSDLLGNLHVYVHEPPLGGKANRAIATALAQYFHVSKSSVRLLSGGKAKMKTFEIAAD